jgi:hypothetical protein
MNYDEQASTQSILKFLDYYNVTNDQGQLLDFKNHAYLWDIYKDFSPKQAILKAAQIGFSTTANIKALWVAKNKGLDIIYSLPSAADIKDFVSGKTNRLIANNPIFQEWTEDKDSIEQKHVGGNVIYFRGTWTERAAIAIPADLYISDETDRSKQDIVQQYKTRLQHSKHGWEWYFSNPSAPGMGVDKYWNLSDQKHWFVKCPCGHEWYLSLDNIMGEDPYFGCLKCKRELDRHNGRWVKKKDGQEYSGYWISALMAPWISAKDILKKRNEYSEEQFSNFVLGQPYIGRGNVLTKAMFLQNLIDKINPQDTRPIIGVDTGVGINYVVGNSNGIFFYDKTEDYEPIRSLLKRWPNAVAIIDQGGDIIGPRKLREEFPNRVFLCFFGNDRNDDKVVRWNDEDGTVVADRSKSIQIVVDEFIEKRIPIWGTEAEWFDYWLEWAGMYRTMEEKLNAPGTRIYRWNKPASGRCDYPFATVYWRIGIDRFMQDRATFHTPGNESFASVGLEVTADNKVFLPKNRMG